MTIHLVELSNATPEPWRNGGGVTRELLAWPPGSGADWLVRVSVADIDRDGPFSPFPGIQRCFAVLEGTGVVLDFSGIGQPMTSASAALSFDGAAAPDCRLINGPTRDLNLMGRHSAGETTMWEALPGDALPVVGRWRGIYAASAARLAAEDGRTLALPAHSLAWCDEAGSGTGIWRLAVGPASALRAWWLKLDAHAT
jgi:environmental stress-induced protein Ves